MIEFEPGLRRADPTGKADAWFVATDDSRALLDTLRGECAGARCFALARNLKDPTCVGFLVVPNTAREHELEGALPLRRVGAKLFVPREAEVWPYVAPAELDRLLDRPIQLLLPGGRFHAFSQEDGFDLEELLTPPPKLDVDWSQARPGSRLAPALVAVEVERQVDLSAFFGADSAHVSSAPLADVPGHPDVPDPQSSPIAHGKRWIARLVGRAASLAPKTASKPTWIDRVARWSASTLHEEIQRRREHEIRRLMKLLEDEPEAGLRFAIPMGGVGRGLAEPSAQLGARDTNFDLGALNRTTPSDTWILPYELRSALERRYRKLAEDELLVGRHRRAAYIYAHLLNDFQSSARALKDGRHHREAAALWRERLNDPVAAADCLESGGLFDEALDVWISRRDARRAAQLLERLGRRDEALDQWRLLVARLEGQQDRLGAADVLERQLGDVEGALETLDRAWPGAPSAVECRVRWLKILEREDRVDRACRWIDAQTDAVPQLADARRLARVLSAIERASRASPLAKLASDRLRVVVGRSLKAHGPKALDVLGHLTPESTTDPLFTRDRIRYERALVDRPLRGPKPERVPLVRTFAIGSFSPETTAFASTPTFLFVLRARSADARPRLECWSWKDETMEVAWEWDDVPAWTGRPWIVAVPQGAGVRVLVGALLTDTRWLEKRPSNVAGQMILVGVPPTFPTQIPGIARGPVRGLAVLSFSQQVGLALIRFDESLKLVASDTVSVSESADVPKPVPLMPLNRCTVIGLTQDPTVESGPATIGLDERTIALSFATSSERDPRHILLTTPTSISVRAVDDLRGTDVYAEDLAHPMAVWLGSGRIVAADRTTLVVSRATRREFVRIHRAPTPVPEAVCLVEAPRIDEFALITKSGLVHVHRIPSD